MQNKNINTYIIIFLILLNIGTLGVFLFLRPPMPPPQEQDRERMQKTNTFLKRKMGWNEEQFRIFQRSREELRQNSSTALEQARQDRAVLVDALLQSPPDTTMAWKLAEQIGLHEQAIQENLIGHYLELWTMSEEKQREELKRVFRRTLMPPRPEGTPPRRGK